MDEVQMCRGFESVLNGLNRRENLDIYVTGSNSKFLSTFVSEMTWNKYMEEGSFADGKWHAGIVAGINFI